jgi:hypothetical protein
MRFLIIFLLLIQGGRVMAYSEAEEIWNIFRKSWCRQYE